MIICFFLIINIVHNVHPLLALYGIVLDFLYLPPKIILFQYFNIFKLLKQSCTVSFPCWITISVISLLHKSKYFSNDTCKTFFEWSGVLSFTNQSKLILKPWNPQMGFLHVGTMQCGSACLGLFFLNWNLFTWSLSSALLADKAFHSCDQVASTCFEMMKYSIELFVRWLMCFQTSTLNWMG